MSFLARFKGIFIGGTWKFGWTGYDKDKEADNMERIKLFIFDLILKKYALGYLVQGWVKLKGWKTQICAVALVLVWLGEVSGYIPKELADQLEVIFSTGGAFAFMQKLQRAEPFVKEMVEKVKAESGKSV